MAGVEFDQFNGDGSFSMGFASRNKLTTVLLSGYLLNAHQIVTAPVMSNSNFLRLEPPFTVGRIEIDRALDALETICRTISKGDYHELFRHLADTPPQPRPAELFISSVADKPKLTSQTKTNKHSFAFLIHYATNEDYVRTDPAFARFSDEQLTRWRQWASDAGPGVIEHVPAIPSDNGQTAEGWLLAIPMVPRQLLEMPYDEMDDVFTRAVNVAKDRGASVLGLGGFTSVITRGGKRVTGKGIPVTTGNCLSSVMAVEGIELAVRDRGGSLADAHIAVVGAAGAIGRLSAILLAERAGRITLVGNAGNPDGLRRCRMVAGEIYQHLLSRIAQAAARADEPSGPIVQTVVKVAQSGSNELL
jgi:hypothetical protein